MKTLKTIVDGKIDQAAPQWIEVKVSHLMHPYFRLVMFSKFVILKFYYFHIECRAMFKVKAMSVAIMSYIGCGT